MDDKLIPTLVLPGDEEEAQQVAAEAEAPVQEAAQPVQAAAPAVDTVAELQKYKMLLDTGVLTEEEFAAKKKQLLGI